MRELAEKLGVVLPIADTVSFIFLNVCYQWTFHTMYRISSNRMRALYSFQCFDSEPLIRGRPLKVSKIM